MEGHQQKGHPDRKSSCSESLLLLASEADLPLSECALYRQTEQERHFRWRGWMLRPRVIRSPTNPKWERSRVRFPLRAACSFCFLFCRLSFFYLRLSLRQAAFCQFYCYSISNIQPKSTGDYLAGSARWVVIVISQLAKPSWLLALSL